MVSKGDSSGQEETPPTVPLQSSAPLCPKCVMTPTLAAKSLEGLSQFHEGGISLMELLQMKLRDKR